uniref:Zinc/iron permease n=1 Tax=Rhizophagus irregularis (strain DAOM 181602 / DAOM 197198 / MUCL 43194) TaxID=747089 RepID=U9TNI4_RHIID
METFLWLFLLSMTMFIGSFLAGSIPLAFHLSEDRLRTISAFGVGLLVGTSLIVIIPEGIETLYNNPSDNDSDHDHDHDRANHHYIGFALISGFAMMFVIDQIDSSHGHNHTRGNVVSLTELRSLANSGDRDDEDHEMLGGSSSIHKKPASATIGLVIHAAADGIALGASASQPALELIVFLAIMLHKAPAAFGLSTILLREAYTRRQIRKHLLTFSLAAPLSAIFTYSLLQRSGEIDPIGMKWWTAVLLLFSGGTFLYVAMHVMQDVTSGNGKDNGFNGHNIIKMKKSHVAFMLLGMFMPLLLQFEHGHGH